MVNQFTVLPFNDSIIIFCAIQSISIMRGVKLKIAHLVAVFHNVLPSRLAWRVTRDVYTCPA